MIRSGWRYAGPGPETGTTGLPIWRELFFWLRALNACVCAVLWKLEKTTLYPIIESKVLTQWRGLGRGFKRGFMDQTFSDARLEAVFSRLKLAFGPISPSCCSYILVCYVLSVLNFSSFLSALSFSKRFQFTAFVSVDRYKHALVPPAFDPLVARMRSSANWNSASSDSVSGATAVGDSVRKFVSESGPIWKEGVTDH